MKNYFTTVIIAIAMFLMVPSASAAEVDYLPGKMPNDGYAVSDNGTCGGSNDDYCPECDGFHAADDYWHGIGSPVWMDANGVIWTVDEQGVEYPLPGQDAICDCGRLHEPGDYWHGLGSPVWMDANGVIWTVDEQGVEYPLPSADDQEPILGSAIWMDEAGNTHTVDEAGNETVLAPADFVSIEGTAVKPIPTTNDVPVSDDGIFGIVDDEIVVMVGDNAIPVKQGSAFSVELRLNQFFEFVLKSGFALFKDEGKTVGFIDTSTVDIGFAVNGSKVEFSAAQMEGIQENTMVAVSKTEGGELFLNIAIPIAIPLTLAE